jgi:hypothetical protein
MMNEFYEELYSENLMTYRLTDGSYIVAEELDIDEETGAIYVASPLELVRNKDVRLIPWILVEADEPIELNAHNIISRSNTSTVITKYYLKYMAYEKIINALNNMNMDQDNNDALDNLDSTDDFFDKLNKPSESRWNWKAN